MRQISRVPRPKGVGRGATLVAFSISGGGGLGSVGVARSSGSPALDRAAVQLIRRAAPFPPPPPGARRSYQVSVEGR